jgi:hypothetical protein
MGLDAPGRIGARPRTLYPYARKGNRCGAEVFIEPIRDVRSRLDSAVRAGELSRITDSARGNLG